MIDWFLHLTLPIQIGIAFALAASLPLLALIIYRGGLVVVEFLLEIVGNIDWGSD